MLRRLFLISAGLAVVALGVSADKKKPANELASDLLPPIRLQAAGKAIDTDVGHAAPCVVDFDGDGMPDLLVGQFGDGLLWIYKNQGSRNEPKLAAGTKFKDGNNDGRVPTG